MSTKRHHVCAVAEEGHSGTWLVRCDTCDWLEDLVGYLGSLAVAEARALEHERDPETDMWALAQRFFEVSAEINAARDEERRRENEIYESRWRS